MNTKKYNSQKEHTQYQYVSCNNVKNSSVRRLSHHRTKIKLGVVAAQLKQSRFGVVAI
jgi:hypothetical protein